MNPRPRRRVRDAIYRVLPDRMLLAWLVLWKGGGSRLLSEHGWVGSLRGKVAVDESGEPLIWIPYCAAELLAERLAADMSALEFGSGNSTLYLMKRVGSLVSIEHHPQWLEFVRTRVSGNVTMLPASAESPGSYVQGAIDHGGPFDFIFVDGIHRNAAFRAGLALLSPRGVILLDDSERKEYAPSFQAARDAGFRYLHFEGHKAASVNLHRTTVFYRDHNCLDI